MSATATAGLELGFAVVGVRPVHRSAVPRVEFDLEVRAGAGREVYMIALRVQLMIDPARRPHDAATRARLLELFGTPERWATTTHSLVWAQLDVVVPAFTAETTVAVPVACHPDHELAWARYLQALPDGEVPLGLHLSGLVYYRHDDALRIVPVPWEHSLDVRLPVAVWREAVDRHHPGRSWITLRTETLDALAAAKRTRGLATLDETVAALLAAIGGDA